VEQIQNATPDGHKGKITVAPKYFIKSESVTGNLYHGTTLSKSVLLKNLDVVQGGSPSEFGIGIYITNDRTAATYAATKNDTINKPPTLGVPKGEPHLRRIFMPSKSKILNLNEKPNKGLRNIFSEAAYLATKDERFSSTFHEGITEIGKMWNAFREGYFKLYGTPASESVVREFQQYITKSFQGQGIKIGVYKGANDITTYIAYDPKGIVDKTSALDNIQPVGYSERVVSQNKLDEITLKQLGDKVSIANYLQSSREVADTIMTQTARELAEIEASMIDELTTATRMEYDIENATADEFVNNAQNLEDTLPQRVEKDYNIKWEKQSQSPCPPIPNKIPRGL
jgi:hypothetical protein